jgi:hypothetical protein
MGNMTTAEKIGVSPCRISSFGSIKADYLRRLPEYGDVRTRVYVGDLKGYFDHVKSID